MYPDISRAGCRFYLYYLFACEWDAHEEPAHAPAPVHHHAAGDEPNGQANPAPPYEQKTVYLTETTVRVPMRASDPQGCRGLQSSHIACAAAASRSEQV